MVSCMNSTTSDELVASGLIYRAMGKCDLHWSDAGVHIALRIPA